MHPLTLVYRRSDATLINGLGRWSGDPTSELAVINVTPGKRYDCPVSVLLTRDPDPYCTGIGSASSACRVTPTTPSRSTAIR